MCPIANVLSTFNGFSATFLKTYYKNIRSLFLLNLKYLSLIIFHFHGKNGGVYPYYHLMTSRHCIIYILELKTYSSKSFSNLSRSNLISFCLPRSSFFIFFISLFCVRFSSFTWLYRLSQSFLFCSQVFDSSTSFSSSFSFVLSQNRAYHYIKAFKL